MPCAYCPGQGLKAAGHGQDLDAQDLSNNDEWIPAGEGLRFGARQLPCRPVCPEEATADCRGRAILMVFTAWLVGVQRENTAPYDAAP